MTLSIRFGISVLSFSKLSCFLMAGFDDFPVQNQLAGRSNMPYSSPFSIKTVFVHFQRFLKSILHSLVRALRSAKNYRRFKRLEDGVADVLAEIIGLSPYYMTITERVNLRFSQRLGCHGDGRAVVACTISHQMTRMLISKDVSISMKVSQSYVVSKIMGYISLRTNYF